MNRWVGLREKPSKPGRRAERHANVLQRAAVEHTLSINEVANQVALLYPGLERLAVSQNMPMSRIRVKVPSRIHDHVVLPSKTIDEELRAIHDQFTF